MAAGKTKSLFKQRHKHVWLLLVSYTNVVFSPSRRSLTISRLYVCVFLLLSFITVALRLFLRRWRYRA